MGAINGAVQRLLSAVREFTIAQRTLALIGVAVLVLGGVGLSSWLGRPTYSPLFTGLSGSDASAVVAQLQKDKVEYQLSDGGATILVPVAKVDQERLAAAAAGLPSGNQNGYALLDNLGVTASEFQQNVTYQRAIQGELAKTIESIGGVTAASVQLAIPKQSVFSQNQQDPTASVFVNTVTPLSTAQVQAIVHLTSAAVAGLKDSKVTVVDAKGTTLSAAGAGPVDSTGDQATAYEARTTASVQSMLDSLVGPGNATVTVSADISASTGEKTTKSYAVTKGGPVLSESTDTSTYSGAGAAGAAGALGGSTPTSPSTTGSGGTYTAKKGVKNNAINETTTRQTIPAGVLNRQTIAVAVNSSVTNVPPAAIQKLVAAAAGVNPGRGDLVTVATANFSTSAAQNAKAALAQQQAANAADNTTRIVTAAIWVAGGLAAAVLLVLLPLLRRFRRKEAPSPVDGGQFGVLPGDPVPGVAAGLGAAQLGGFAPAVPLEPAPTPPRPQQLTVPMPTFQPADLSPFDRMRADIDALAESDPERTADYLRALMTAREDA